MWPFSKLSTSYKFWCRIIPRVLTVLPTLYGVAGSKLNCRIWSLKNELGNLQLPWSLRSIIGKNNQVIYGRQLCNPGDFPHASC